MKPNKKEIIVNTNQFETRVAVVEHGRLVEFYVERLKDRGLTGNIYKGKIVRVLPGMQSAFVEAGLARTAFLHVSDVTEPQLDDDDDDGRKRTTYNRIQDAVKEGQEIMVQVAKEPIGTKGARVTSYISLPGRYLVFMPTYEKVSISRRISNEKERRRLRDIVAGLKSPGHGFIIRTVCEGMDKDEIKADMDFLVRLWQSILKKRERVSTPGPLYEELDLTLRIIRDIFSSDVDRLVIDSPSEFERASKFVEECMPAFKDRLELFTDNEDIFDAHGIEIEMTDALEKKVWLRSGGHIIIDQMEALTAVDVNTGKYVGKKNSDDTILKTNLEAVAEVVYQLRLRNIGGIIVIDFIDMAKTSDRETVYNALKDALRADKARTNILKISELGIVEMTRKRVRESLTQSLCEPCPYCEGNGLVKSRDTVVMDIYRELEAALKGGTKKVTLMVSRTIADYLRADSAHVIEALEKRHKKKVVIQPEETFHQERFEIE
ncbi:MAG: ribonuclease G [Deltaproteobacteria bacterium RIFCSPLOWO2_02_FULL_53_8]|nr:MAG: ribonuclease G [Deltaproteobacteria bacterium RIFCSPLOWO2_02_FULL_53_8]